MAGNNELEKTLWTAADKLRSNMDAAEYKHIVLGPIFLKYISDAFSDLHEKLKAGVGEFEGADAEDTDEYLAQNIFFVPEKARWQQMNGLAAKLAEQFARSRELENTIRENLKGIGYEF